MRIVKKEKMDVKKFMEEMKATRTNRSYTSLQPRSRQQTNEEAIQDRHYVSRPSLPEQNDPYRPSNPQPLRYNFDQGIRYAPYNPTPYPPPRAIPDFAPSQHYTATPPFQQHSSFFNYSQPFNSQVAYPHMRQDSARYQQNYGEMGSMGYSQVRGIGSKLSINNETHLQPVQPERSSSLQEINHHSTSASKPKPVSPEPVKKSIKISNKIPNVQPKEEVVEKEKPLPEPQKKKRKPRQKKMNPETIEKAEEVKPDEVEKVEEVEKVAEVAQAAEVQKIEDVKAVSISKKFQQILAEERKKLEDKLRHKKIFKEIVTALNNDIEEIMRRHFTPTIVEKLKDFGEYLVSGEHFNAKDETFEQEVNDFETEMLQKIARIS